MQPGPSTSRFCWKPSARIATSIATVAISSITAAVRSSRSEHSPPEKGNFVLQASLYHAGLSFFKMQPADYLGEEPNDWSLCRRTLQAGVRFGMVDRILADKYESRFEKHADWRGGVPSID